MANDPLRVLIVGATSAIAAETARVYAAYGARLFLTGRHAERLEAVAADLRVRGATAVETAVLDVTDRGAAQRSSSRPGTRSAGWMSP